MINYQIFGLVGWLGLLDQERRVAHEKARVLVGLGMLDEIEATKIPQNHYTITEQDRSRLEGLLKYAEQLCQQLKLSGVENRVVRFRHAIRDNPLSPILVGNELRTLHEALQDDLHYKYFYFYPDEKAKCLLRVDADWAIALTKFPSIKSDAIAAVDCYALGHDNASVFSCMMILECGLRALAAEVGIVFNTQQWKNLIDEIEGNIERIRENGIPGLAKAEKDARLQFLSEAAKEFFYFKDAWRNYVSHKKANYDERQALGVLEHTRAFMNHLASQLAG